MQINVSFDLSLLDKTAKRYEQNLAYSAAQAINAAALEAQKRIREQMAAAFHLRKADFMMRSVKIFAFASVGRNRVYAELGIDNKPRLLLSMFETGGQKAPWKGKNVAVPVTGQVARSSIAAPVNPSYTFQALHFQRGPIQHRGALHHAKGRHKGKLGGEYDVWQGANRTFILTATARAPFGGVFQRVGPRRDDIRLLYSFRANVTLRKALSVIETTQEVYQQVFADTFVKKFYRL